MKIVDEKKELNFHKLSIFFTKLGGSGETRTPDQRIKSPLL